MISASTRREDPSGIAHERALDRVREALGKLRFGTVTITVHEGRVVQVDVTEKHRIDP